MKTLVVRRNMHYLAVLVLAASLIPPALAQTAKPPAAKAPGAQIPKSLVARPSTSSKAATTPASQTSDKVVLKVGNQQVTQSDIDFLIQSLGPQAQQALAQEGRAPLGEQYALMLLLSQKAEQDHLDTSPEVRRQLAFQRQQALAQAEYQKLAESVTITPEEVNQYYTQHATDFDRAQVREFVIRKHTDTAPAGTPGLSAKDAQERADSIRKALAAGTDPKKVAAQFGGTSDVLIDAEPRTVRRGQLIPQLDKAAFELKDGQVSDPLDTPQAVAFLQVVGHTHADLKDVSGDIENDIRQQKLQALVADLRGKASVWMDEEFFKPASPAPTAAPQTPKP